MRKTVGMKIILQAVTLALFISAASAADEPFGYKGMPLGATEEEFREKHFADFTCHQTPGELTADKVCTADSPIYAGVEADSITIRFYFNKISSVFIVLDSDKFGEVRDALVIRYGMPKIEVTQLSNAMGAKFMNETFTWRRGDQFITATKYSNNVSDSTVSIGSNAGIAEFNKRNKRDKLKKSGDL